MANGDQRAEAVKYWKIQADGLADIGMFYECTLPSMTLTATSFKVWDENAKPNELPVGVQASFGDVVLSRGVDRNRACYTWISTIAQKGANAETVKEVTLLACNAEGEPVETWTLMNAYPTSYQSAAMAANGTDVLTEKLTLRYTDAQLDGQGGLTGQVG